MSADKQYDRQFLAWAVDRALRYVEVTGKKDTSIDEILGISEALCGWIMPHADAVETETPMTDEEKAALEEHAKHLRGEIPPASNANTEE